MSCVVTIWLGMRCSAFYEVLVDSMHIEGELSSSNLHYLPEGLVSSTHALKYLHLDVHPFLSKLPSFHGLTNMKRIELALMLAIDELPSFESLVRLEQLNVVYLSSLRRLPDLAPLVNFRKLTLVGCNPLCCNGFWGVCETWLRCT
uniref:Uncharacterized protein n=1 Tax=Globisporangium ultimum (strain ATCC 200006 / CBS 805.95 / DAOM BR144) TaxID=431595 RepID=K3WT57_GLOUD